MNSIKNAVSDLKQGKVVIIPTETVYGLAADACRDVSVASIFKLKGRPTNNPLIVHGYSVEQFKQYTIWNEIAQLLANKFWPGPLTMVLPIKHNPANNISKLVLAGNDSVAVRIPDHNITLKILQQFDGVLAAPSANPSKYISPTNIQHVKNCLKIMKAKNITVVDGGPCNSGIESTIIDLRSFNTFTSMDDIEEKISILRHGAITKQEIIAYLKSTINKEQQYSNNSNESLVNDMQQILPNQMPDKMNNITANNTAENKILAPGMMAKHYSPSNYQLKLNISHPPVNEPLIAFGDYGDVHEAPFINLSKSGNLQEAARNLFAALYKMEQMVKDHNQNTLDNKKFKHVNVSSIPGKGIGIAINDRLIRAAR